MGNFIVKNMLRFIAVLYLCVGYCKCTLEDDIVTEVVSYDMLDIDIEEMAIDDSNEAGYAGLLKAKRKLSCQCSQSAHVRRH